MKLESLFNKVGLQLYQKEAPTQVLSCEIHEIFKNTYFEKYLRMTAFENKEIIFHLDHGTIIPTGIICKKIRCYMHDSACRWFTV